MKKWKICYREKSGDIANVWVCAETKEEAKRAAKREYWDIDYIIEVIPL